MFQLIRIGDKPVLMPDKNLPWEAEGVFNAGVVKLSEAEGGQVVMLYRAVGEKNSYVSHIGMAKSKDGINFTRTSDKPVLGPSERYDKWATEDPRITKIDDDYYVTYVAVPDRIMDHGHPIDREIPLETSTALLKTRDFITYENLGVISPVGSDNKDIVLFPKKIPFINEKGETRLRYAMLHRPNRWSKDWLRGPYASKIAVEMPREAEDMPQKPSIWIAWSDDLVNWGDHRLMMQPSHMHDAKNGPGLPPIETPDGWLVIYHHVREDQVTKKFTYTARAALFDLKDPTKCLAKFPYDILWPEKFFEIENGSTVVFPTGGYIEKDILHVYYGCSDRYVGLAGGSIDELLLELKRLGPPIMLSNEPHHHSHDHSHTHINMDEKVGDKLHAKLAQTE